MRCAYTFQVLLSYIVKIQVSCGNCRTSSKHNFALLDSLATQYGKVHFNKVLPEAFFVFLVLFL